VLAKYKYECSNLSAEPQRMCNYNLHLNIVYITTFPCVNSSDLLFVIRFLLPQEHMIDKQFSLRLDTILFTNSAWLTQQFNISVQRNLVALSEGGLN
jgi:hypothetical protein